MEPRATKRDLLWASLAVAAGALFVAALARAVAEIARNGSIRDALIVAALAGIVAFWVGVGAWRRTSWGAAALRRAGSARRSHD